MRGGDCGPMSKVDAAAPLASPGLDYALRLISGEATGSVAAVLRCGLSLLSGVYAVGLAAFLLPYRVGIRRRKRLPCPVISIGNITFGGAGKTPTVRTIARELQQRGLGVVILSRGHGGSARGATVVSDGRERLLAPEVCGDEPAMLADLLPGIPVIVGRNRYESGMLAVNTFGPDIILLDDGMQYWQLHRDLDVVLINAVQPFGYGRLMPRGALREPVSGLRRAGAVLITNSDRVSQDCLDALRERIMDLAPSALVVDAEHKAVDLRSLGGGRRGIDWLRGRKVATLSSIGTPGLFTQSVAELGGEVVHSFEFPDHHMWRAEEIDAICSRSLELGAEALVTTEKDAVKIGMVELDLPMLALDILVDFKREGFVGSLVDMVK